MTEASGAQEPPAATTIIPLTGLRGAVARNMSAAWQAPQVAMGVEADMSRFLLLHARLNEQAPAAAPRIPVMALILRAVALALSRHPALNAVMRADGVERKRDVNLAFAVALPDGLVAPVIRDAAAAPAATLASEYARLSVGAHDGSLPPKAYQTGTFTVSNLGPAGVDWFTPILNPPQVGILGLGRIAERWIARDGQGVVAPTLILTLVFDHRGVDGYPAALFLATVRELLEEADALT